MQQFWQQVAFGLATGGVYSSLALAIVLIYRATRVINFAQGEMATLTTFLVWSLGHHMPFWAAFFVTLGLAFAGGVAIERIVIRPVERASVLIVVIVTVGLAILLNGLTTWIWGGEIRALPPNRPFSNRTVGLGGVAFSIEDLGAIGLTLAAVVLLFLLFRYTKLGLALRASALNPDASRLVGIRVGWMLALAWGLAAMLGTVAGVIAAAAFSSFDHNLMEPVLLYAFAAAVLGGIDSPVGAVVGGLALGVFLNLLGTYVNSVSDVKLPVALALILVALLLRPAGLFGRVAVRRV